MLRLTAFTTNKCDTPYKAGELLEFFGGKGSPFAPNRYGRSEEAKQKVDRKNMSDPAEILSGAPGAPGGSIFLKGAKFKFQASLQWSRTGISDWYIELDDKFFDEAERTEQFVDFIARLFTKFPAAFGGAAPEEDWKAKHWLIETTKYGEVHRKVGLELGQCLPGIYWLTIVGEMFVEQWGKDKLSQLPVHRVVDLGGKGLLLVVRESPYSGSQTERQRQDKQIADRIGAQFFFDITNPEKKCSGVPSATQLQSSEADTEDIDSDEKKAGQGSAFEQQTVLSPEGTPYTDPELLAEAVVVYYHGDLHEVFGYSRSALQALDAHFAHHPPREEFKREFLAADLIPAIGAYLGKVVTRELGGKWLLRDPIMRSTVVSGHTERNPFLDAYSVVMEGNRLVDVYNAFQG